MKLKLNMPLRGLPAGHEIEVETDKEGIPLDKFWRRRLRDSEIDNCVEKVVAKKSVSKSKEA